ncbi:DUF6318 family protein [Calidifontibacter indicus]|uniref:DUF6318 domain-containing protein n=1 Tax=Calidifontibacter indicus TaxID=419650 RepID=A0A3D9UJK1_9MICO|nr:DUF6318 family protein [Calidifontibacter indicus]REF29622.1 hypothetical protein DFJ65_0581 [Calidifontibacter indicus]
MTARPGRIVAPILALALAGGVLTGCSGGSSEAESSSPSSTSTTATSSTTSTAATTTTATQSPTSNATYAGAPGVPEEAKYKTDAGAIAFAKYYLETVNKVGKEPKVGVLEPLALPSCKTCVRQRQTVSALVADKQRFSGDQFVVLDASKLPSEGDVIVSVTVDQPATDTVDAKGSVVEKGEPLGRAAAVLTLIWTSGWRVAELQQGTP